MRSEIFNSGIETFDYKKEDYNALALQNDFIEIQEGFQNSLSKIKILAKNKKVEIKRAEPRINHGGNSNSCAGSGDGHHHQVQRRPMEKVPGAYR